jgi:HlyD family secretion protein
MDICLWEVLQVPASEVFRDSARWAVFVVEDGVAHKHIVEAGARGGLDVQIVKGLSAGERVVTHPDDALEEGVVVRE